LSGVFENQGSAVVQLDFLGFPCRDLVEAVGIGIGGIPGTVEPIEIRFVGGDPFLDCLPEGSIGSMVCMSKVWRS